MALLDATLNSMGDHLAGLITHFSLHSADPGATGANETTAPRVAATWSAAATGGDISDGPLAFTGGAANGPVTHVGYWGGTGAATAPGGTFRGSRALGGGSDTAFNAAGEYTVTSVAENGSSS